MMKLVFEEHCVHGQGVTVTVSVPNGMVLAKKTLNHTLGIEGGISIIDVLRVSLSLWVKKGLRTR